MKKEADWGAYLDGAMTPEESAELDALLESDAEARSELQAYKAFMDAVKHAGRSEPVPLRRLESSLQVIAGQTRPRRLPIVALAVAACLLIALVWAGYKTLTFDSMALATTPTEEQLATTDPQAAMQWVHAKTSLETPRVELRDAELVGARYGEGWACYDFETDGESYYLYMSAAKDSIQSGDRGALNGTPVYRGKGIGWVSGNLAYYLKGGDAGAREQLASRAIAAIEN